jgi:ATP-binding protein involved in chromosome partitioning
MSKEIEARVWDALKTVSFPGMSRDIVSFGFVRDVKVDRGRVTVRLRIQTQNQKAAEEVRSRVENAVSGVSGVSAVGVEAEITRPPTAEETAARAIARDPRLIPEVKRTIAVASGKGGVGKSTVAANLAVALGRLGHATGLLDADIYGPSQPIMLGYQGARPRPTPQGNKLLPFSAYGIKTMSLGSILDADTPVIWRGPMVMKAIEQLLSDVEWGALDFLVVDLPPGTGDAQLTLTQKVPLSGAVIVTTPQDVALIDARKGLSMFTKVNVPVLGIVENMSTFVCPHCGKETHIFRSGGGERTAAELGCPFLGSIPLDAAIAEGGDAGVPIVVADPEGPHAAAFRAVAEAVARAATVEPPRLVIR